MFDNDTKEEDIYKKIIQQREPTLKLFNNLWNSLDKKNKEKARKHFNALVKKVLYEKRKAE